MTDGEYTPRLDIPVRANASFNLRYQEHIRFRRKRGVIQPRTLRISANHSDKAPKLEKIEDPDGLLKIERLDSQGPMALLRLDVDASKLPAEADDTAHPLIIHTNDRDQPRLELDYRVLSESAPKLQKGGVAPAKPIKAVRSD